MKWGKWKFRGWLSLKITRISKWNFCDLNILPLRKDVSRHLHHHSSFFPGGISQKILPIIREWSSLKLKILFWAFFLHGDFAALLPTFSFVSQLMHQSFETPAPSHSGLSGAFTFNSSESEWSPRFPGTKVSGAVPHLYFSTHSTPFVKQLTIAKHNTLVKKQCWQAWNKQIDLWAACK